MGGRGWRGTSRRQPPSPGLNRKRGSGVISCFAQQRSGSGGGARLEGANPRDVAVRTGGVALTPSQAARSHRQTHSVCYHFSIHFLKLICFLQGLSGGHAKTAVRFRDG